MSRRRRESEEYLVKTETVAPPNKRSRRSATPPDALPHQQTEGNYAKVSSFWAAASVTMYFVNKPCLSLHSTLQCDEAMLVATPEPGSIYFHSRSFLAKTSRLCSQRLKLFFSPSGAISEGCHAPLRLGSSTQCGHCLTCSGCGQGKQANGSAAPGEVSGSYPAGR